MKTNKAKVIGPRDGKSGFLGSIGVRFMIDGADAGERFSLVEHPLGPRALAAPLHRHIREDEYSFVLEGRMGALLGDEVLEAGPGSCTPSGTPARSPAASSKSSRPQVSSASSASWWTLAVSLPPARKVYPSCAPATNSRCARTPCPSSSSALVCDFPANRSQPAGRSGRGQSGSVLTMSQPAEYPARQSRNRTQSFEIPSTKLQDPNNFNDRKPKTLNSVDVFRCCVSDLQ
jgi:mannose-6-phosphate isomerase-like protein (cupin superfamily)